MVSTVDDVFGGRYELGELLGSGGTGTVRRAHDPVLDRPVAIKLLRAGAGDDVMRARLRAEAQLAGQLHHPGIAQVYDFGEDTAGGESAPYIVMQYVEGTSLWQVLRDRRTLPPDEVMGLVAQVAEALQVAHEAGIVHRDLKPGNMLLTPDGRVVLVDFGIARSADTEPLTMTGTIVGTADYISPEQAAGRPATGQSDLYALGLVAYECLTGHKPFRRESEVATALAHLKDEAPPLPDGTPSGVRSLVGQLMRKDPRERPRDAAEVARRARTLEEGTGVVLPPPAPATPHKDSPLTRVLQRPALRSRQALLSRTTLPSRTTLFSRTTLRSRKAYMAAAVLVAALAGSVFAAARPAPSTVPDLRGMSVAEAMRTLHDRGIGAERRAVDASGHHRGDVLGQQPAPGSRVADDTVVVLKFASGKVDLAAADLLGKGYAEASRELASLGLVATRVDEPRYEGIGSVVAVGPTGRLSSGSTVTLTVAVPHPAPPAPPAPVTHHPREHGPEEHGHHHKGHGHH